MKNKKVGGNYNYYSKNPIVKVLLKHFCTTVLDCIREKGPSSMIDIGCGEGHLTNAILADFRKREARVTLVALDYDMENVTVANTLYPSLKVGQGNILDFNGTYDLLIATEVLEHVPEYEAAIVHCKQAARTCIFSVPHEPWFRLANICALKYMRHYGNTPGHVNNWTKKKLRSLLQRHFQSVRIKTSGLWNIALCEQPHGT